MRRVKERAKKSKRACEEESRSIVKDRGTTKGTSKEEQVKPVSLSETLGVLCLLPEKERDK